MKTFGLQAAEQLVAQALEKAATQYRRPICVAVCDGQGFLLAFARKDGAPVRGIEISQGKAYSAARMGTNTDAFLERLNRENLDVRFFCDERLTPLPGGAVLKTPEGQVLGGVGISGLSPSEDRDIACALADLLHRNGV